MPAEVASVGVIEAVCTSGARGVPKVPVAQARLEAGAGLEGDAHADGGDRQVSLLPAESADRVRAELPDLAPGAFGENLLTRGLDLGALRPGDCIMPREGVFARVLAGGTGRPGDPIAPHGRDAGA